MTIDEYAVRLRGVCWLGTACWIAAANCGCGAGNPATQPAARPATAQELVGKWQLVKADGQSPAALNIKSLWIDIAADGTWQSDIEMLGQFEGMTMQGGGKWSLTDDVVAYTSGDNAGKSRASVVSGRLILDPDFTVLKDGTDEVVGEYERP